MPESPKGLAPKYWVFLITAFLVVGLDQITKILVVKHITFASEEIVVIPGFLSLIHVQNPGAALGILRDLEPGVRLAIFGIFTLVAAGVLLSMLYQLARNEKFQALMLALIFSGAIGNAIDRVDKRTVTDFIKVYTDHEPLRTWLVQKVGTNEYPTWNVADAGIVVGVALFLIYYLFLEEKKDESVDKDVAADVAGDKSSGDAPAG